MSSSNHDVPNSTTTNGTPELIRRSSSRSKKEERKRPKDPQFQASTSDTLSFIFDSGTSTKVIFALGLLGGIGNGFVYPILAYVLSSAYSQLSGAATNGMEAIRSISYKFMVFGTYALFVGLIQTASFEVVAYRASKSFRLHWFRALLRQDPAFYDVYDIGGLATTVGSNANQYRLGIGLRFGQGIQFLTTAIAGLGFALYSNWRVALVVFGFLPFVSVVAMLVIKINQTKGARSAEAYKTAGGVAYSTVSAIKTVLSLNAIPQMIDHYTKATAEAFKNSTAVLWKQGFLNGLLIGSFIALFCILTLFGSYLLYRNIENSGCDPSGSVKNNRTCSETGKGVFGALLGMMFAAQGVSQVGNFFETFTAARVAAFPALRAIQRKPGSPQETIYKSESEQAAEAADKSDDDDDNNILLEESGSNDVGTNSSIKAVLPEYRIDSSSDQGAKPEVVHGSITFKNISFSYPTRPDKPVLQNFSLEIPAGKTVALVGPSGGGKSTVVLMIERFYDPLHGSVELDGIDLKDINVKHLRSAIGYVGQEPTLFATTIAGNIKYGNPNATQEEIEAAARKANAHDFIVSFPDGYNTQVGDRGAQLSGGQKQRIAIARVLVGNPSLLLLDEATSALDGESELVVQEALDNVVAEHKRTTIIIAHRLSTIRNADLIAVISNGQVAELGTHDELMESEAGHYRRLVLKQDRADPLVSRENSQGDVSKGDDDEDEPVARIEPISGTPHFLFRDVVFAYPTRPQRKVFKHFNLSIGQGETVALVGPSGGGKSTTVALIERFYDPLEGALEYLGHDITSLNLKWYRDQIGYVGQEPTLFNETIAKNIAYGAPGATLDEIKEAARQANAHDFIISFPKGYDTMVGERGAQLSGGQKQRVAIARALVKKPKVLLLDEATSALDTESEAIVQDALDKLMSSRDRTIIVIAHRLSTIRNADRIAFIENGVVKEYGSHDELVAKPHGRYQRLIEFQGRGSRRDSTMLVSPLARVTSDVEEDEVDWRHQIEEEERQAFSLARARSMASPDATYMAIGAFGAIMAGGVYPAWGVVLGETVNLLFQRVERCTPETVSAKGFGTCKEYQEGISHSMRHRSYEIGGYWVAVAADAVVGNILTYWGFGMASEHLNKRVRDSAFSSLVRQEVSFFDKRSVGSITAQLEDDSSRIHAFTGEPLRSFIIAVSSILTGLVIAFSFMWPFALASLAVIPFTAFAATARTKQLLGQDQGAEKRQDELFSPSGILVETLLNIRTVAALTLEQQRFDDYAKALVNTELNTFSGIFITGINGGLSAFTQQWANAFNFWWGGYLIFHYPDQFAFKNFLIANYALLLSVFGLGAAVQGLSDRKEAEMSAGRIFYVLDRQSEIDPLSKVGKTLD